jgi:hypothetical protein
MQIKIYDEVDDYEVDTLNLDNYELDDELLQLIIQIIQDYQDQLD